LNINFKKILLSKVSSKNKKNISRLNFGINVAGHFKGTLGIGEAARNYAIAIRNKKIPHVLNTVQAGKKDTDTSFEHFDKKNPHPLNLLIFNAYPTKWIYKKLGSKYFKNKYNIAIWFWELSDFPEKWIDRFQYYNEIWVASNFLVNSISKLSPIPVIKIECPVVIDEKKFVANRSKFKLNNEDYAFLFIFDFDSVFERKNPIGLIDAFNQTFDENEKVILVIKAMNGQRYPLENKILVEACKKKNILLLDEQMTKDDIYSLIGSTDCFVSLHRSEGLGLTLAEAMYAKKPVIATSYGGNTDFMNNENSFLVKYELVKLEKNYGHYEKGNVWANPDISNASYLLRHIYENQELGKKIGENAQRSIKNQLSYEVVGNKILNRINNLSIE